MQKDILDSTPRNPQHNEWHKSDSVKGTGLDEHGDNGLVQSTSSRRRPDGISNVPAVQDESNDDHEGEDDIESSGNRKVWGAELSYGGIFKCDTVWSRALIDERDTHHCVNVIGQRCRGLILENIPNEVRYIVRASPPWTLSELKPLLAKP